MLSRVANSLYWMSRYVERAESTVRLVDVNLQLLLDFRNLDDRTLKKHWMPVVESTGDQEPFARLYPKATGQTVTDFLVFQTANPNSIVSSVIQARENARMVRDQVSVEVWEELNRMYLFLQSTDSRKMWRSSPHDFFAQIKATALQLHGLTDTTQVRNEGWHFVQAGRYLERADKTSRLLDVRHTATPQGAGQPTQEEVLGLSAVLRSSSGWDAYKQLYGSDVRLESVAELLLLSEDFPRSVRFCVQQLNSALRRISGVGDGRFSNDAEKLCGRLLAELQFSNVADLFDPDIHRYIDRLQTKLNAIGDALFQTYISQTFSSTNDEEMRQQEEQQQQQRVEARAVVAPA